METSIAAQIGETAQRVLSKEVDLIEGCRSLVGLFNSLEEGKGDQELFMPIIAFESETEDLPVGALRSMWEPQALAVREARAKDYLNHVEAEIIDSCRGLVAKYSPAIAKKRILDRTLSKQGVEKFSASSVIATGEHVSFSYPSGASYTVPLEYIITWFGDQYLDVNLLTAIRSRRVSDGHIVRVYLSNGGHLDVAWDTVLMACEPLYEHYGGLTTASKTFTKRWSTRVASMKDDTQERVKVERRREESRLSLPPQTLRQFRIRPRTGLGDVFFGDTVEDVERLLGPASDSKFLEDGDYSSHLLSYPSDGLSLFFRKLNDFRLSSIEVSSAAEYYLFGEPLFPRSKNQILDLLQRNLSSRAMTEAEEDNLESLEESSLWIPSLRITFYFDRQGALQEFQWEPLFGPNDEIVWPKRSA